MAETSAPEAPAPAAAPASKPINSLVLDTGPLIKNDPSVDALRARAENLYILPSVIPEIRDAATRTRVETQLLPFVTTRAPKPDSVKFVREFARRTGDLEVLSRPDLEVIALGYELECEKNGGDWRLRNTPGQKTLNGRPPAKEGVEAEKKEDEGEAEKPQDTTTEEAAETSLDNGIQKLKLDAPAAAEEASKDSETLKVEAHNVAHEGQQATDLANSSLADGEKEDEAVVVEEEAEEGQEEAGEDNDDDDDGWITPSNIKKHKAKDDKTSSSEGQQPMILQAAILTSDYAMQNVALRMNLNLVSPALTRISRLRTWVLRCHGCFKITRDMERRFCPTCGQQTLIRAACTVDDRTGNLTVHLKKNFQWNNRGNVYSVPKPVHGTPHGKGLKGKHKQLGGGKNGWGTDLILAEDQKEHIRRTDEAHRVRKQDVMDQDYIPGILTGDRGHSGPKVRVGAGRNVNSRKRN